MHAKHTSGVKFCDILSPVLIHIPHHLIDLITQGLYFPRILSSVRALAEDFSRSAASAGYVPDRLGTRARARFGLGVGQPLLRNAFKQINFEQIL